MKEQDNNFSFGCGPTSIGGIYWLFAVIYAFVYWGAGWGVLNIFIPFAPIWDLVVKLGKIK